MRKPTREQVTAALNNQAHDVVGRPRDPNVMRQAILKAGGSEEEANQAARWAEIQNEKDGFGKAKAS